MKKIKRQHIKWRKFLSEMKPVVAQKMSDGSYAATTLPGRVRVPDDLLKK